MPSPDGLVVLALDFDGTLVEHLVSPLRWRPRARAFVIGAAAAGMKIWIHSCRCTPAPVIRSADLGDVAEFWRTGRVASDVEYSWTLFEEMRSFLEVEGVLPFVEFWTAPGKPIADMYPDDLGERPDWLALAGELGVRLDDAEQRGHPALGGPIAAAVAPAIAIPAAAGTIAVADAPTAT